MNMNEFEKIDEKLTKSSKNLSKMCSVIKVLHFFATPLFAILVFFCSLKTDAVNVIFNNASGSYKCLVVLCTIVGIAACLISLLYYFINKEEEFFIGELNEKKNLLIKYEEISKTYNELEEYTDFYTEHTENDIKQINNFLIYIKSLMPQLITKILACKHDKTKFFNEINPLFNMLYENLDYLYDNGQKQLFTIALYLFDNNEDSNYKLKPYYSKKPVIMKKGRGRHWQVGDGQIGYTFLNKLSYNYKNIATEINPKTLNSKNDDNNKYVSALSFPVLTKNNDARGVFCITSNIESAFMCNEDEFDFNTYKAKETCTEIIVHLIEICLNEVFGDSNSEVFSTLPPEELEDINKEKNQRMEKQEVQKVTE